MTLGIALATMGAGAIGALARYLTGVLAARIGGIRELPVAVLVVNVIGSFLAGLLLGMLRAGGLDPATELILVTGVCGGLTTFSTLSVETVQLALIGRWRLALLSVGANLVVGLGAVAAGWALGAALG